MSKKGNKDEEKLTRIAIVDDGKCKPRKCNQECRKHCPVVRMGKQCVEAKLTDKLAYISEELCIGCGICVKKCPFEAISIINLPKNLDSQTVHRYGPNSFKLHRLPTPRAGQVLGLVGTNGIGKSTAVKILAGKSKPNLGRFSDPPEWSEILVYFRGSELQNFFNRIVENKINAIIKPQYVDSLPKSIPEPTSVGDLLTKYADPTLNNKQRLIEEMELTSVIDKTIDKLSGGELQRFAIAMASCRAADVYMYDEPSSYLDVKQRLQAASTIRGMTVGNKYVVVVEHDLSVLDFLSDYVCVLYGTPGAYGVVTMPFSVREGINIFLAGFLPTENLRFRDVELTFKVAENFVESTERHYTQEYPDMSKTLDTFHLDVKAGNFTESEIIVLLGQNGTGKTTFIRMLAGLEKANDGVQTPILNVSYKPQKIAPKFEGTVRQLFIAKIAVAMNNAQFISDVMKPMKVEPLMDQKVKTLSGGELQRVALVLSLGVPADIYLIDEPSAYLDSEQRIIAARVIKRFILHAKKTAFIVEHDFIMSTYLASRVIVYEGIPAIKSVANPPQSLISGMNKFLTDLNITFRRDPTNYRPRINKLDSQKDTEQKKNGHYFFVDTDGEKDALDKADKAAQKSAGSFGGAGGKGKGKK